MEQLSAQIASLRQSREISTLESAAAGSPGPITDGENFQEVIKFLRREKEIVDIQYEGSQREAKRLKQQLDHTQSLLEQTREKLNQERQNQAEKEQIAMSHSNLMQTINELNAFRESNASLRNETRQAQVQLAEKIKDAEKLRDQIQPLQTRLHEVEAELENKQDELRLLAEDRDHWQKRVNDIIQKYDRVDPAELEALRQQITSLTEERDHIKSENTTLQERIEGFSVELKEAEDLRDQIAEERRQKLIEAYKKRSSEITGKMKEKDAAVAAANEARELISQELAAVKAELETVKKARDEAVARAQANSAPKDVEMTNGGALVEDRPNNEAGSTLPGETQDLEARLTAALQQAKIEADKAVRSQDEVIRLQTRITELEAEVVRKLFLRMNRTDTNVYLGNPSAAA